MLQKMPHIVLFAHGSRDPVWAEPLHRIAQLIVTNTQGAVTVHHAFLEMMKPSLPELVAQLAAQHVAALHIVPIFLGRGTHVRNDLSVMLERLQHEFPALRISCQSAIGENETVLQAIAAACTDQIFPPSA